MDVIYSTNRKPSKIPPNLSCLSGPASLCAVSCRNLIAFTTVTELNDTTNATWGCHVYISDLNTPWQAHKITTSSCQVTVLEWDITGRFLLVCDNGGDFRVFSSPNHMINQWLCTYTASFKGEHILAAAFFHNGRKMSLLAEKKDSPLYNEKFAYAKFDCSVRGFGGKAVEGALVITSTGLFAAVLFPRPISLVENNWPVSGVVTSDSLGAQRKLITDVDICYGKNGNFLVATTSGTIKRPIQCYRISVKLDDTFKRLEVCSQAWPSLFITMRMYNAVLAGRATPEKIPPIELKHLRWVTREDANSLVTASIVDGSYTVLQIWELHETKMPVHSLLATQDKSTLDTVRWQFQSQYRYNAQIRALNTNKLSITNAVPPPTYIFAAMSDNTIHCLHRDTLKQLTMATLSVSYTSAGAFDEAANAPKISHLDTSWLGNVLHVVDTFGQTYLYKIMPVNELTGTGTQILTVTGIVTLLEYCIVSGLDCMDVLISSCTGNLRGAACSALLESSCDRLTDNFNRQTSAVQQFYYLQFLYIKIALYRLTLQGQAKANDLCNLLMLYSIATAFKSLLRPSDMTSYDKSPVDALAANLTETQTDVDKILLQLEAKDFAVEPRTLQSLQQLIQWVADLVLTLLARLPTVAQLKNSGYELLKDVKALNTIRELLVIIRIWGLLRQSCLPVFVRSSEAYDPLLNLFRMVSQLAQNPHEPDETLIDECIQLPNQVTIPNFYQSGPRTALPTPLILNQKFPLQFEYDFTPDQLTYNFLETTANFSTQKVVDVIRHAYLGNAPRKTRLCVRCGGRARTPTPTHGLVMNPMQMNATLQSMCPTSSNVAIRAWEQRWLTSCRCGGLWTVEE